MFRGNNRTLEQQRLQQRRRQQQQQQQIKQQQQQQQQGHVARPVGSVRRRPPSAYNSKSPSNKETSMSTNSASTGSKSCLVVPGFGKKNSRRSGGRRSSAASATDQSSATENIFNPRASNDRQSLLFKNSNQLTADWYNDNLENGNGTGNASTINQRGGRPQQQQQQQQQPSVVTPTSQQQNAPSSLLAFPAPKDRSHNARRQLNQRQGVKHSYDGELEPDGVRGQEATIQSKQVAQESAPDLAIRDFQKADIQGWPKPKAKNQLQSRSLRQSASTSTTSTPSAPESRSTFQGEQKQQIEPPNNLSRNTALPRQTGRYKQQRPSSLQRRMSDNVSTTSSQDIESLMQSEFSDPQAHSQTQDDGFAANFSGNEPPPSLTDNFGRPYIPKPRPPSAQTARRPEPPASSSTPPTPRVGISPRSPDRSRAFDDSVSYHSNGLDASSQGSHKSARKSAPVNVDDASFEAPQENVQGIHAMAMEHVQKGEFDMALTAFSQVLEVYLAKYGPAHAMTASAYHNLGTVHSKRAGLLLEHSLHQRHCREQALVCFQSAARSARDAPELGPSHPNVALSLVRIGFLLLQSRQYQNAVITFHEALRIRLKHYGPNHGLVGNLYNNLGICHMHLQEFVVGRRYLRQALDIQRVLLEEDEFSSTALLEIADTLCNLGGLCLEWIRQQGPDARHALDAETAFLEAIEIRVKVLGEDHHLTAQARSLHDMIRSIPLPKTSPRGSVSPRHQNSPGSRSGSNNRSPRGVSFQDETVPGQRSYVSPSNQGVSASSKGSLASEALDMPALQQQQQKQKLSQRQPEAKPPMNRQPTRRGKQDPPVVTRTRLQHSPSRDGIGASNSHQFVDEGDQADVSGNLSENELRSYEAMEENCLLGTTPIVGQLGIVSYSQSAIGSTSNDGHDRNGYMKQARALLDAHDEYLDSPQVALSKFEHRRVNSNPNAPPSRSIDAEDSLTPLGGNWPKMTVDKITPEVLQDPQTHLRTIHKCASDFFQRGRYDEALHLLELVVEVQRAKNGPLHKDVGSALHNTGLVQLRLSEPYEALQAFEEAVRIRKGSLGRDHAHVAASLVKVGIALMILDRLEDALWIFREALTVRKNALGPLHPSTARIYNNIGCVHVEFNEIQEAKRAFDAALDIQRNALVNDPETGPILFAAATTLQNIAYLYRSREMFEQEAAVSKEALTILEQVFGKNHTTVLKVLESLAEASTGAKDYEDALRYYTEYLERLYDREDSSYEQQATIHFKMAKIHGNENDVERQLQKLHLATKILRSAKLTAAGKDLEHAIQVDFRRARQAVEMEELNF